MNLATGQAEVLAAWRAWIAALKVSGGAPTAATISAEQAFAAALVDGQANIVPTPTNEEWFPVFTLP
jgi:hypothetical protein